jgi:exodeoxyribonuclease VII large subunit
MSDADPTNLAPLTVSELSGALKRTVEDRFGLVRVRGEISGFRGPHSSGHCYFTLKDATARLDAVIWKGVYLKMKTRPEEGIDVVATGKITTFPGKSSYQIVVESLELAGLGALMALLEKRRQAFAAEGLFDQARKRPLPFLPETIGVVTSPTGAVIRDILHRLADRFPRRVIVWPVRVQGETSADEVAAAIRGFDALRPGGPIPRPDVLIVARGGGSLEDLWGFNEEAVVRAAADCAIPLISAVGHETDWTLLDHVADMRAPTPTAAAEMATPVRGELALRAAGLGGRALEALSRLSIQARRDLVRTARGLPAPERLLDAPRQRLDFAAERVGGAVAGRTAAWGRRLAELDGLLHKHHPRAELAERRRDLSALAQRLAAPKAPEQRRRDDLLRAGFALDAQAPARRLAQERRRLADLSGRLATGFEAAARLARAERGARLGDAARRLASALSRAGEARRARIARAGGMLETLSYRSALARGYAVVRRLDAQGRAGAPLSRADEAPEGAMATIEWRDGSRLAQIEPLDGAPGRKEAVASVGEADAAPSRGAGPSPEAETPRARKSLAKKPTRDDGSQGALF